MGEFVGGGGDLLRKARRSLMTLWRLERRWGAFERSGERFRAVRGKMGDAAEGLRLVWRFQSPHAILVGAKSMFTEVKPEFSSYRIF